MSLNTQRYPTPPRSIPKSTAKSTTPRLRSACDSCHQAKTKCSGTSPCLSCQMSATPCTYSPCNQPGRPKGSKNKRSVIDVKEHKGDPFETPSLGLRPPQSLWQESIDFNLAPLVLENPLVEELRNPPAPEEDHENDFNFVQPPFQAPPSSTMGDGSNSNLSPCDSPGYATPSASVPNDDPPTDGDRGGSCSCLQRHVYLVYQLGDLQSASVGKVSAPAVLEAVRRAQSPWTRLQECRRCRGPDFPQEVLLLFAVSIRILLSAFRQMNMWDPEGGQSIGTEGSVLEAETDVLVGSFEVTGTVKAEMVNLILRNALEQVLSALMYLQSRSSSLWASLLETTSRAERPSSGHASPSRSLGLDETSNSLLKGRQTLQESGPGSKRARV
ncbi:hypothetical protein P170DRAFT_467995 [Aspergillus steynii IBT 23096]|uniref:Zn(2)-C6 fungal-type domain-containing protein n=1 Tax=Aspergillus steynii IBT 23096 TaxID=1392250 RepID=A0A2I2FUK2_9EURO|nr:uncharacterized protein P170DRAFT_467995 [Aspergillus steynii IBT 23096]PLB44281.1 hypothetical protein P170DRAFT_467995 [Aspergillus steynii IBT 23096]